MHIVCVDPRTDPRWRQLIACHPSSAFHSPHWAQVLVDTYGLDVRAYVLLDDAGATVAGVPFCRISDMTGDRVVALPFSDYCDPLVGDHGQWRQLSNKLLDEGCPVAMRCLHNTLPLADQRFQLVKQAKWHGMDLRQDVDTLWRNLHESSRRAINKARRDGLVVRMAQEKEALRAFFEIHLKVRKYKYRLLAQPYLFFENIWRHFLEEQRGVLMVAEHQGALIGGVLFLEWQGTLYYKFNASISTHLEHRPNDLIIWEGIHYAHSKGLRYLDFGLSDWEQEGLVRFKRKFATDEKTISFLRYAPNATPTRQEQEARSLLPRLTDLFTAESVPDSVTEKAGDVLYRLFT